MSSPTGNNLSSNALSPAVASGYSESDCAHRKLLSIVIGCILQESGCIYVEKSVVGTLVEILQSLIGEIGRTSKGYCELAYRTEPLSADVLLAFSDLGLNYSGLQVYSRRTGRQTVAVPQLLTDNKQVNILQVGDKNPHLPYIPENLPSFPDTHTYCFTPTVKQPVTEYEAIREKSASQKRDIEKALTKFSVKTNPTESLFIAEDREFQLVVVTPTPAQNIDALMPRDQVFEAELDFEVSKARKKRQDRLTSFQQQQNALKQEQNDYEENKAEVQETPSLQDSSDNPYLQQVKMPKKIHSRKSSKASPVVAATLGPNINKIVLSSSVSSELQHQMDMEMNESGIISPTRDNHSLEHNSHEQHFANSPLKESYNREMGDDSHHSFSTFQCTDAFGSDVSRAMESNISESALYNSSVNASDVLSPQTKRTSED